MDGMTISTCSRSLLHPGNCCAKSFGRPCPHPAELAVLTEDMVEHTRCSIHAADGIAEKPLVWDPVWGPS